MPISICVFFFLGKKADSGAILIARAVYDRYTY